MRRKSKLPKFCKSSLSPEPPTRRLRPGRSQWKDFLLFPPREYFVFCNDHKHGSCWEIWFEAKEFSAISQNCKIILRLTKLGTTMNAFEMEFYVLHFSCSSVKVITIVYCLVLHPTPLDFLKAICCFVYTKLFRIRSHSLTFDLCILISIYVYVVT